MLTFEMIEYVINSGFAIMYTFTWQFKILKRATVILFGQ